LIIAGPDEFRLKGELQKLTNELGIEKKVIFPGVITGELKLDLLARADLFCLPSAAEGFSMAILESLASATPVLISPGCNFPKVENAGAGRIVSPKSECLASALSDLLAFPEDLKHMGELGRQFVSRYYSWDRITDQLLDVYREGIERHKNII
jgi:glycosyltransferase involved in cell wall biosynthesis